MPAPKELERLGGLFNLASESSRPFLDRCSETKYLAIRDYSQASSVTVELAKQSLKENFSGLTNHADCKKCLATLQSAVELGQLDTRVITALEKLRSKYLEKVLSPAVRTYLKNDELKTTEIELLYNDALKIDGLLEVIQFLKKVEPVV
ncbi:MAG: hypothetical protein KGD60_05030 [Candidatus Thorarchaeota archaeon]|nr:hypothetical protein [Candidatus Thorarchaeota archaeon]